MSDMVDLVRVLTASTGTSTVTLGAAYSQLFMTPAEAGAVDGRTYTYLIVDSNNWELGKGVYTASGTLLSRVTVLASRISGTLGTTKVSLSGTAQVRFVMAAEDISALRGTRAVTGTSDTISNTDLGRAITYSNASAIAASLAQAGTSGLFLDGWTTEVKNTGAGTLTITPATSTINGASTLVLAQNLGAFIWSDGTNYHAYFVPVTKPLLAGNNLSEVIAATARTNLGVDTTSLTKTSAYTVVAADYGALIKCSGTFTLSFTAAATLGDKFKFFAVNNGSGIITLDPNGSETLDAKTTRKLWPGQSCEIICDGSSFFTLGISPSNVLTYTPVLASGAGTITSYTASGRYVINGNRCIMELNINVTNNGTGNSSSTVTLPVTGGALVGTCLGAGREPNATGTMLQIYVAGSGATLASVFDYKNAYPLATGYGMTATLSYEIDT